MSDIVYVTVGPEVPAETINVEISELRGNTGRSAIGENIAYNSFADTADTSVTSSTLASFLAPRLVTLANPRSYAVRMGVTLDVTATVVPSAIAIAQVTGTAITFASRWRYQNVGASNVATTIVVSAVATVAANDTEVVELKGYCVGGQILDILDFRGYSYVLGPEGTEEQNIQLQGIYGGDADSF